MTIQNRRAFFKSAAFAIVPAAGLAGSFANASPVDPHPALLEKWRDIRAQTAAFEGGSGAYKSALDECDEIERKIMLTPATTAAGIAAQIRFAIEDSLVGQEYCGGYFDGLDATMFENIATALEAAA